MPELPFDWNKYLTFAQTLVSVGTAEAAYRIATSRAYYADYWKARQLLEGGGIIFPFIRKPSCITQKGLFFFLRRAG